MQTCIYENKLELRRSISVGFIATYRSFKVQIAPYPAAYDGDRVLCPRFIPADRLIPFHQKKKHRNIDNKHPLSRQTRDCYCKNYTSEARLRTDASARAGHSARGIPPGVKKKRRFLRGMREGSVMVRIIPAELGVHSL